ncbi:MAG TPA: anaerobic ribonucleoside-triphosphate reductase [Elusimicrobiales bacterium]|mgnify:CR=1 FL=1|nr:anaerobic ribonucleoside-triphosphate reductase [Elusimicrobiales bacterium]
MNEFFPKVIKKRDGKVAPFNIERIKAAIYKAAYTLGGRDEEKSVEVANEVARRLNNNFTLNNKIPTVDDSNAMCVEVLREKGFDRTADKFESYSLDRQRVRRSGLSVKRKSGKADITDQMLLVQSITNETIEAFDRAKLAQALEKEYLLTPELSAMIAKETENDAYELSEKYGTKNFDTQFLRRLAESHLSMMGIPLKNSALAMPLSTIEGLVFGSSKENSNITSNNPEAVNLGIAEYVLKQYNLRKVFSEEIAEAHNNGSIHIHDLGYPQRVYCSSHSIEYIKKYGLDKIVSNLQNKSNPAKSAMVLNGHIQTFLASMQSRYAGALGFGFLNILYAPMLNCPELLVEGELEGKSVRIRKDALEAMAEAGTVSYTDGTATPYFKKTGEVRVLNKQSRREMRQIAQNLIFSASQNAFSRGGQTLFIDFNMHTGVPQYMHNVPAMGPGGKYMLEDAHGNVEMVDEAPRFKGVEGDSRNGDVVHPADGRRFITYGDPRMVKTAQEFAIELMKVWEEGDKYGIQFAFPKCDLHVSKEALENPDEREVYEYGCRLATKNGSTYFMFDRDGAGATLAQCCRLKEKVTDPFLLKHPENIRFTGFQNVTINLPQAAFKGKTLKGTLAQIDKAINFAVKAHLQKKAYTQTLLDTDGSPLRSLGIPSDDGTPYVDLNKATYIMGLIGLNEVVQYLTGKELHESRDAYETGLQVIDHMHQTINALRAKHGLKITLEETPAESATQKLAKGDMARFPESRKVIKGDIKKAPYYTNSVHLNPGANVSILDRIELQSKFHDMIESGSIIHVYCGESQIPPESIAQLVEKTYRNTRASQITVSPEFTHCNNCHTNYFGFKDKCGKCGSDDMTKRTKIVGYFSNLSGWNDSQLEISKAREAVAQHYADFAPGVKWLHEKDASKRVMVFGKAGCAMCEEAKASLTKALREKGMEIPVEFHDLTKAEARMEAARWNVPLDPIPTVLVKNNGTMGRYELEFKRGKPVHRKEVEYFKMVESAYVAK